MPCFEISDAGGASICIAAPSSLGKTDLWIPEFMLRWPFWMFILDLVEKCRIAT
jgi:hypothetical protein